MSEPRWYIRRYSLSWEIVRDVRPGFVQWLGHDRKASGKPRYFRSLASAEKVCDRANFELARQPEPVST